MSDCHIIVFDSIESREREKREERKRERDVLSLMLVTLDVFHFERSPLNSEAPQNAIQKKRKNKSYTKERK